MQRRSFLQSGLALTVSATAHLATAQANRVEAGAPTGELAQSPNIFIDPDFGFTALIGLGHSYYSAGDPGKMLTALAKIVPGDFESAWIALHGAGEDLRALASAAAAKKHVVSAREAYLGAASFFNAALRIVDSTANPDRADACFQQYAECWSAAAALFAPPAERVEIPYEGSHLTGWFLRADPSRRPRPLVIINNGADGLEISSYVLGAAGALRRGHNCLIFNGPGQSDSLWLRKLYFRPDWEEVITPVLETMLHRPEVDRKRIALLGISQGSFWAARALASERRIAAAVFDPGIWDISEPWLAALPKAMRSLLEAKDKAHFDFYMERATASSARTRGSLRSRIRPFGESSPYEVFDALRSYNLDGLADKIRCPTLVTSAENEHFAVTDQAKKVYDALTCPKDKVRFTHEQGADQHCEVAAPGYRDYAIYNWLDERLV